ncbi:hypothetical protein A3G55_03955 [Candidatus Giovannonibacteria bacterium RIFCSPLOWO2_12_FULL_44_25]|uniref:HicB-like antitoxin of toxin-antitoxin system domain-containing protein n=4 Tax=Candidatus Giovannoniibacteriota TaxID=1752738 RepID=A0A0G1KL37_9BACT|nr:MAG: hypothetical protein UW15_C0040G0004 [Parcubacteria group bacterium GW2011_GWC1_44_10]KKT57017.1 MAG: hypothetical protein UW49_C0009G0038 [Candidatus Giovannonibacteria bacterium GW2011_GWB1_44_23]KKT59627.1 MAG: hypothetical protein UW53_C0010G0037 [Candidatus Giovannonibacteria bacterium GW2011_GWA1_44_25]KKT82814.1 MAG: hypothetical protein UW81_C0035G0001 [Candidatus Giovannonibacteria bacterium GW2011_GWC2_44_9]OGF49826.1 MAG: hypothetical protein A2120_01240 [Candidatus Giovannon
MKTLSYRIIIEPDGKRAFHGYVPALQGCHTWGKTVEETREHLRDAINVYLKSLVDDGEVIPEDKGVEMIETVTFAPRNKELVYA